MADDDKFDFDPRWLDDSFSTTREKTEVGASLSDVPKAVGAGAIDMVQQGASAARFGLAKAGFNNAAEVARGAGELAGAGSEALRRSITPGGRRAMDAQFIPDDEHASVGEAPFSSALMKASSAAAPIATAIALPEARLAQAAGGAALQTGQNINQAYQAADATTQNSDQSQRLVDQALTPQSLVTGAAAGAVSGGALGSILHGNGLANGATSTLKRVGAGALEGGGAMGLAGAQSDVSQQSVERAINPDQDYDFSRTLKAGVNAAGEGAVLGGAAAGITGGARRTETQYPKGTQGGGAPPDRTAKPQAVTNAIDPDPAQNAALATNQSVKPDSQQPLPPDAVEAMKRSGIQNAQRPPLPEVLPAKPAAEAPTPASPDTAVPADIAAAFKRSGVQDAQRPPLPEAAPQAPTPAPETAPASPDQPLPPAAAKALKRSKVQETQRAPLPDIPKEVTPAEQPVVPSPSPDAPSGANPDALATLQKTAKPKIGPKGEEVIAKAKGRLKTASDDLAEEQTRQMANIKDAAAQGRKLFGKRDDGSTVARDTSNASLADLDKVLAETRARSEAARTSDAPVTRSPEPEPAPAEPAGRVLKDVSKEGKAAERATTKAIESNIKEMNTEKAEPGSGTKNWTKAQLAARDENNKVADEAVKKFAPKEGENAGQRRDRATAMVKAAIEAGWKKPGAVRKNNEAAAGHGPSSMLLDEAQRFIKGGKNASDVHFDMSEKLLRSGKPEDLETYLASRREQGKDVMTSKNGVKTQAEREAALGHSEEIPDKAPTIDHGDYHEPTNMVGTREHAAETKAQREVEARNKAALPPTEGGIVGENKAGKFKVETVKRRTVTPPGKEKVLEKIAAQHEGKSGVAAARLDVNTNPTEAQKRAGNYSKGHVKFEGHSLALENPKDSERSGVDNDGTPWSHTMPADYGYIKDTKGHDRDAVDAFIGPKGETGKAYIVNQRDPRTGAFDEHKVVFGTKSVEEARALYEKSFGDGSGGRRITSIAEVHPNELKRWLKEGDMHKPYTPEGHVWGANGNLFTPSHTTTFREIAPRLQPSRAAGGIQRYIARQLRQVIGDIPIHVVTRGDMRAISEDGGTPAGYYDIANHHIVVQATHDPAAFTHAVMHEAVHAATYQQVIRSATIRKQLRMIIDDVRKNFGRELEVERSYEGIKRPLGEHYGLDEHLPDGASEAEFLAEAFGNDDFQRILGRTPISREVSKVLGLRDFRVASAWNAVKNMVRKALRLQPHVDTALDAVMAVGEQIRWKHAPELGDRFQDRLEDHYVSQVLAPHLRDVEELRSPNAPANVAQNVLRDINSRLEITARGKDLAHYLKTGAAKLMTGHQLFQMTRHKTGEVFSAAHEKLNDAANRMDTRMHKYFAPAYDMARDAAALGKKYMGDDWQNFMDLVDRAGRYNVHPDVDLTHTKNAHLSLSVENAKKGDEAAGAFINWQGRAKHAELQAQFNALPDDLQNFWRRSQAYYTRQSRAAKTATLDKMLYKTDLPDAVKTAARAGRVSLDDFDPKYHGVLKATNSIHKAFKQTGPYYPSYRRGEWITHGELAYAKPEGAKEVDKHVYEFDTREAAHKFATGVDLPTKHGTAYYNSETGERSTFDDAHSATSEPIAKYRVEVNPRVFETHETQREANAHNQAMVDSGKFADVQNVQKRNDTIDKGMEISTPQMKALVDAVRSHAGIADKDRADMEKALYEAAVTMFPGNGFAKRMLGKAHTLGRGEDMARDFLDYGRSLSSYRAKAEFAPEIDEHLGTMRDDIKASRYHDSVVDKQEVLREVTERIGHIDTGALGGDLNPIVRDAMLVTGLKRMASLGHVAIHMAHPFQMSLPVLAARHGMRAAGEIGRVYKDISALDILKEGGEGFKRLITSPNERATNFLDNVKERLAAKSDGRDLGRMLDALVESGHIHPDNMFDFTKSTSEGNKAQQALYRVDNAFREVSGAAEMINRAVDAIASYRLERQTGKSHEEAVKYAKDTVASTQGFYSAANRIPVARSQLGRMAFQFKGYSQNVMALLAESMHTALHDADPATRKEAWKRLAYVTATSGALGGIVGLPIAMDMAKLALIIANAAGLTSYNYGSLEDDIHQAVARQVGGAGANVVMHGVGEAVGLNVGHRLGAGGLLFGEPKSYDAGGITSYLAGNVFGAPLQAGLETVEGAKNVMEGKTFEGLAKLSPVKQMEDTFKAAGLYTEGKLTRKGKEVVPPVSLPEATLQAIGLQPASIANAQAARAHLYERQTREKEERSQIIDRIAHPQGDMLRAIQARVTWNREHPDNKITDAHIARARQPQETGLGYQVNKRNEHMIEDYKRAYNIP